MDKLMMIDHMVFLIYMMILGILIVLISNSPELPVYYLVYMLGFLVLLMIFFSIISKSDFYYYIFLIISGGIMVTFLFFMVFNNKETYNMGSLVNISIIGFVMILGLVFCLFANNSFTYLGEDLGSMSNCYIDSSGMLMTMYCMTYLLLILYLMVKISTTLKSCPMRELKS